MISEGSSADEAGEQTEGKSAAMTRQPIGPDAVIDDGNSPLAVAGQDSDQLSRSVILQTALAIVDRDGVDGLSMRRLSNALSRDPVMLYRHVHNKAAVLDGVVETVLAQLVVDKTDPDWAAQLRTVAHNFRQDALHIYRLLFGYLYGHILNELQEVIERPDETDHVLRLGLHRFAITEFPLLRALAPALASYDGAAELDRFLDLLLPGLTASLSPES